MLQKYILDFDNRELKIENESDKKIR